jgi:hypothetical protein
MDDELVAPPASTEVIRNCRFAFRCTQQWDTLDAGTHPRQRYCGECERHVVLCESDDELRAALRRNDCVAIPTRLLEFRIENEQSPPYRVGGIMSTYRVKGGRAGLAPRLIDGDKDADTSGT